MKSKSLLQQENRRRASLPHSYAVAPLSQNETDFKPAADAVAMRAYFIYLRQGSLPGHDLHHWLEAETQLRAERSRPFIRGFATRNRLTLESPGDPMVERARQNGSGKARPNYEQQLH
jgi:hypothetical protein